MLAAIELPGASMTDGAGLHGWAARSPGSRPAVFLDRDGTLIQDVPFIQDPADVVLRPFAAEALAVLRSAGFVLVVVTNQSGIGRGLLTEADYSAVTRRVTELLRARGATIDGTYFCPDVPGPVGGPVGRPVAGPVGRPVAGPVGRPVGGPVGRPVGGPVGRPVGEQGFCSPDRKPGPGMLLRAAADLRLDLGTSWMIGDRPSDVVAGWNAGCRGAILLGAWRHLPTELDGFCHRAGDLAAAARQILSAPGLPGAGARTSPESGEL